MCDCCMLYELYAKAAKERDELKAEIAESYAKICELESRNSRLVKQKEELLNRLVNEKLRRVV